ncbi:MAG: hypothetical protein NC394_08445 [Bacteroides sp.]|nr:hypothetical protein [Bacteroides sp.]
MADVEKLKHVEFNNQVKVELDIGNGTEKWGDMTKAFKNINQSINENTFTAAFLCDGGFNSTIVTGASPTLALSGYYVKGDPVCEYLDENQYEIGDRRISRIKMTRGSGTVTCSVTITSIAISGGESSEPTNVSVTLAFNGKPTFTKNYADEE